MRILIFHGYMLRGTGSNIYNANLARAFVELGHEVRLLCQDRHARDLPFVDAVGSWDSGVLRVEKLREPVRCTTYLPDIGRTLPVYVADEYEGFDAVTFGELGDRALDSYLEANVAAVAEIAARADAEVALANHVLMGPVIVARGLDGDIPFAVKVHGSALEYTLRPNPKRFLPFAREGLEAARGVLVGSRHTAESLFEVVRDPELPERTRLGPPGVDVDAFQPRTEREAAGRLTALADRVEAGRTATWGGEGGAAAALRRLDPRKPTVAFVGKLIVSKGVDLLLAAWPLVHRRVPDAELLVVGFGAYRDGLHRLGRALAAGDLDDIGEIAAAGRELEGGPRGELRYLRAFIASLHGEECRAYVASAGLAMDHVHYTGRLEYADLGDVLPACSAQAVPSTFPEAFGMVAAEAACCGLLPVSAAHSGLAEVTASLAPSLAPRLRSLLAFELGPDAVRGLAENLIAWLELDSGRRAEAAQALSVEARRRYGWEAVANGVLAAAQGRLSELPPARDGGARRPEPQ